MKTCRRKWFVQWVAAFVSIVLFGTYLGSLSMNTLTVSAICCRKDGFDKSRYTLTGNVAQDVATIAKSQAGRTCSDFGYSGVDYGAWCDEYVADCLENAGCDDSIVAHGGTVADFEKKMRKRGAVVVSSPQPGDLLFFSWSHVEIVTRVEGGTVYCAGGNNQGKTYPGGRCAGERNAQSVAKSMGGSIRLYLRPNYKGVNPNPDPVPTKWYDEYSLADVGTDFCAYIINTEAWKHITNESTNNVIMHNENGYAEQIWRFTKNADGSYKIINCKTGYALDRGGSDNNVYVSPDCGNDYQSWYIYGESGAYFFKPRNSDNVMDISGGSVEDGANVGMFEWNGTTAQKFQIWKLDTWTNLGLIQNVGTNFYAYLINVYAWKHITNENNDNVLMRNETAYAEQVWKFIRNDDGSYKIVNCKTGKVIDWDDKSGNVYVNSDNGNDFQKWYIYGESGAYILKPKNSSCVLDITSGSVSDGANVQIYDWNGTTAQKFQIWRLDDYKPIVYGDLNSDNTLTTADAVLLQRYLLGEDTLTQTQWQTADLNADGTVNGFDLALLRQKLVG
ncbi:MAG: RICIN domain-containing protein [Ruminococcus callidus]|uniref:RICIN domain-containing protein n=1 Tax=Ruminococcus callidus TaxID=40519 RepID=UPI002E75EBF8|nr:RICIN domain-containing protein [Ruminococcus callidus]MEE0506014.1 RICIN domain-containing protein [Ruminococcus callidus]